MKLLILLTLLVIRFVPKHATDTIMIHSIQTAPEETVLVRSLSGENVGTTWEDDVIPQQLHVSRLPSGSLSLGPDQVAIVPVTFLPRYPELESENINASPGESKHPPSLSSTARLDLVELVGDGVLEVLERKKHINFLEQGSSPKRRNNIDASLLPEGDEFEVSTTVVVDTSRGVLQLPISATSVRQNAYNIPDTIFFHHPSVVGDGTADPASLQESISTFIPLSSQSASISAEGVVLIDTINAIGNSIDGKPNLSPPEPERECYDLYLSNPSLDNELEISEILISRPELMSVEFDPSRILLAPDFVMISTRPSQVIREFTEEGPMYLPADSVDNYVATICTAPNGEVVRDDSSGEYLEEMSNWIDSGNPERSLGFVQIRTDAETLFIGLERFEDAPATESFSREQLSSSSKPDDLDASAMSEILLKAVPDHLDFHLMSSASPAVVAHVSLNNKSPVPIRIMRVTVAMDTNGEEDMPESTKRMGLKLNVTMGGKNLPGQDSGSHLNSLILGAAESVEYALTVSCAVDSDVPLGNQKQDPQHFTGVILIRGTMDMDSSYENWRKEILRNPYSETHLTLELPYTVSVLNGRVEVMIDRSTHPYPQIFGSKAWDETGQAIAALFFPMTQFEANEGSELPLPTQSYQESEIGHDLRVLSNMAVPLKLEGAEILDASGSTEGVPESICSKFNVSVTTPFKTALNNSEFEELGFLALQYKFSDADKSEGRKNFDESVADRIHPTTCYLNIITSPVDTGIHRIPLLVFPGQLEVSSPNSLENHSTSSMKNNISSIADGPGTTEPAAFGFDRLMAWLRSSAVGKSLLSVLEKVTDDKKASRSDSHLLVQYLRKLCQRSSIDKSKLKPILLEIGAIGRSEIARAPLYLTNHNPVPMSVNVDVSEVEGMSIALGRDTSQGRGDGINILDHLPKQPALFDISERHVLVNDGIFEGHSMNGLRQFLLSNEVALTFSSRFPFRDAVSMSSAAVAREPILQSLYKWYSHAQFHRSQHSEKSVSPSLCDSSAHPPTYMSFDSTYKLPKQRGLPGPFLISADQKLARPLKMCVERDNETSNQSGNTRVLIPPGGTARFEVRIRAPPQSYLENDISNVLATGLVLSTNFGHVMPIFATFEALQGQLHVSRVGTSSLREQDAMKQTTQSGEDADVTVIGVPLGLFWQSLDILKKEDSVSLSIPPAQMNLMARPSAYVNPTNASNGRGEGVSLHIGSSFSREVRLIDLESCNPWFKILLRGPDERPQSDSSTGVSIGSLYSVVSCLSTDDSKYAYPSYYQCALNWLTNRSDLQPPGCGFLPVLRKQKSIEDKGIDASHHSDERVIKALEQALGLLNKAYSPDNSISGISPHSTSFGSDVNPGSRELIAIKSARKRSDGFISPTMFDVFSEVWDAWRVAAAFGINTLSSNFRATIQYDALSGESSSRDEQQSLTLSVHNMAAKSVLAAPRLFDNRRFNGNADVVSNLSTEIPSTVTFPPTLVGSIVSMSIPLRNPTSVPVRVRLGAAPQDFDPEKDSGHLRMDETTRKSYFQNLGSTYVQNGQVDALHNTSGEHLWWDGDGAFFLADERGDVIRSHHNISIRAGPGARVSLVNPSLHASVAFLVGCGERCGMRDESQAGSQTGKSTVEPKLTSPIGASAAAGITLSGRKRWSSPQVNAMNTDEPKIFPGGTPIPGSGGPAAFALPYSALDEIVLPPHGVGEIGPILFRPPGRHGVLGCDIAGESGANHWDVKTGELCNSQTFEAMVFLENSLTGLERLVLKGESLWERLYFLDPPPEDGDDAFGDIELRNGRPTLLFPGSSSFWVETDSSEASWKAKQQPLPVVKEVLLHNGGDVMMDIVHVYFSDTINVLDKKWPSTGVAAGACIFGSFRLLDCWESNQTEDNAENHIMGKELLGFKLKPGESRSLFVEHIPDCTQSEEYVTLNVEYRHTNPSGNFVSVGNNDILSLSRSGEMKKSKSSNWKKSFRRRKIDLVVGYHMDDVALSRCVPASEVSMRSSFGAGVESISEPEQKKQSSGNDKYQSILAARKRSAMSVTYGKGHPFLLFLVLFMFSIALLAYSVRGGFIVIGNSLSPSPVPPTKPRPLKVVNFRQRIDSNSARAFRIFARADPTSAELQTLGREQIRQMMISRYRTKGVLPPQSYSRERSTALAGSGSRRVGKEGGASGNDRVRTLSDAMFHSFSLEDGESNRRELPAGLGWRTAFSRGIIDGSSIDLCLVDLKTRSLLQERRNATLPKLVSDESPTTTTKAPNRLEDDDSSYDVVSKEEELVEDVEPQAPRSETEVDISNRKVSNSQTHKSSAKQSSPAMARKKDGVSKANEKMAGQRSKDLNSRYHDSPGNQNVRKVEPSQGASAKPQTRKTPTPTFNHKTGSDSRSLDGDAKGISPKPSPREKGKSQNNQRHRGPRVTGDNPDAASNEASVHPRKPKANKGERMTKTGTKLQGKSSPSSSQKRPKGQSVSSNSKGRSQAPLQKKVNRPTSTKQKAPIVEDSVNQAQNHSFRLPPGLAPPPGFGQDPQSETSQASPPPSDGGNEPTLGPILSAALSKPDSNLTASPPSAALPYSQIHSGLTDLLFSGNVGETMPEAAHENVNPSQEAEIPYPVHGSPTMAEMKENQDAGTSVQSGYHEAVVPILTPMDKILDDPNGSQNGFDVMDFLDSILNDGVSTEQGTGQSQDPGMLLAEASDVPLLSNPWASEGKSRAAAYGISFDDVDDRSSEASPVSNVNATIPTVEGSVISNIPLLTPASLKFWGQEEGDEEEM